MCNIRPEPSHQLIPRCAHCAIHGMKGAAILICFGALAEVAEGAARTIGCQGREGKESTRREWVCGVDGSATCTQHVIDCSACGGLGAEYQGEWRYDARGGDLGGGQVGGGWDCRGECRDNRGASGGNSSWKRTSC